MIDTRIQDLSAIGLRYNNAEDAYLLQDIYVPILDIKTLSDEDFTELLTGIKNHIAAQYAGTNTAIATIPDQEQQEGTIIDKALITLKSGSETLQANQVSSQAAKNAARTLIDKIKEAGQMTPELYEETMALRKKVAVTFKSLNDRRKPFTQAMDLIKSTFTACENELKETVEGTELNELALFADEYVKQCALEKKRQEDIIEQNRLKAQALIDWKATVEKSLSIYFNDYLAAQKQRFNNRFNAITLDTYVVECKFFTTVNFQYPKEHYSLFKPTATNSRLTPDEQQEIFTSVVTEEKYKELCSLYFNDMITLRLEKTDILPSKKNELDRIREFEIEQEKERMENLRIEEEKKTADAARKQELEMEQQKLREQEAERKEQQRKIEEDQAQRQMDEQIALDEQNRKNVEQAQSEIAVQASLDTTSNLFAAQADASNIGVAAPKTKTGYDIEVCTPLAWLEVMNFWFQNEGAGWDAEKMRKKFEFMTTAMEKLALKSGTMLVSDNIKYHETYASKK